MASSKEFVEYAAEQLREAGTITYRRMFGEYGWYCDGKFMGVICDDQLFMKITQEAERLFPAASFFSGSASQVTLASPARNSLSSTSSIRK